MKPSQVEDSIVRGLADRARNLLRALDRQDRLETATEFAGWLGRQGGGELTETALEVLLRALRVSGDPVNFRILEQLDALSAASVVDLMAETGLERVAVSERVNELVQAGLASRELIDDQIRATPLAEGLVVWVRDLARQGSERLQQELAPGDGPD